MAKNEATRIKYLLLCPHSERLARHLKELHPDQIEILIADARANPAAPDELDPADISQDTLIASALASKLRALAEDELETLIGPLGEPVPGLFEGSAAAAWESMDEVDFDTVAQTFLLGIDLDRDCETRFEVGN